MALIPSYLQPIPSGTAKSFAYDETQYQQTDTSDYVIPATTLAAVPITSCTTKQLKSLTITPLVAETAGDFIQLDLYTAYAQAFGTATAVAVTAPSGTVAGTSFTRVRVTGIIGLGGTGIGGATGTQAFGLGTAQAFNATYVAISGCTATMTVAAAAGTNVTVYTFPSGPNGGLTIQPGDLLVLTRGTSSVGVYAISAEFGFTPGGSITR